MPLCNHIYALVTCIILYYVTQYNININIKVKHQHDLFQSNNVYYVLPLNVALQVCRNRDMLPESVHWFCNFKGLQMFNIVHHTECPEEEDLVVFVHKDCVYSAVGERVVYRSW